jgi:hypothetical protein
LIEGSFNGVDEYLEGRDQHEDLAPRGRQPPRSRAVLAGRDPAYDTLRRAE